MYATYVDEKSGERIEFKKKYGEEFPKEIKQGKKVFKRYFDSVPYVDVAVGMHGNAKNGYESQITYHPSSLTPNNSIYGKYGRTAGVEVDHNH